MPSKPCKTKKTSVKPEVTHEDMVKAELMLSIQSSIAERTAKASGHGLSLISRQNPAKAAQILMLYASGHTQSHMVRRYGLCRRTIQNLLVEYADSMGTWRELGGKLSANAYLALTSLEEDLIDEVRTKLEAGELKVSVKDLKEIALAKSAASREALTARGEASSITEDRKVYSQQDYEDTLSKAKERIAAAKQVQEVVDV